MEEQAMARPIDKTTRWSECNETWRNRVDTAEEQQRAKGEAETIHGPAVDPA